MKTPMKIILPIVVAVILLIAIFFLAPLNDWKEYKRPIEDGSIYFVTQLEQLSYFSYCLQWWRQTFSNKTVDGGELPFELTVTTTGASVTPKDE